jgi:localization factor PodJL
MNRAAAWSVQGVGRETRDTAEVAARRAGMSLGEWLDEVVADQAAEQGVEPGDLDRDEKLDAIGARLDRLSRHEDFPVDRSRRNRPRDDEKHGRRATPQPQVEETRLAEEMLEAAIAKFESRAAQSDERTARALGSVAAWIERNREGGREAFDAVAERLASIEERIAKTQARIAAQAFAPNDKVEKQIEDAARGLDERMNQLARRIEASEKARADAPRPAMRPRLDVVEAVSQIARRREELEARTKTPAGDSGRTGLRNFGVDAPPQPAQARAPDGEAGNSPKPALIAENFPKAVATEGLQSEVRKLNQRLDDLRRESGERRETPRAEIEALRGELSAMSRSLADLAPRNAVVGIEGAIRDLTQRVAASRDAGSYAGLLAPIEAMIGELRASLHAHDPRHAAQALEREIRAINEKIDQIAQSAINPKALERIRQQSEEARNLLAEAALRAVPVDRLEKQIGELADRIDRMNSSPTPHADTAQVAALLADARALIERSTPPAALAAIERRLELLAARMDQAMERPASIVNPKALEEMSSRIESLRGAIEARPAPQVDMRALDGALRDLSAKLENSGRSIVDLSGLEGLMREINAKLSRHDSIASDSSALERMVQDIGARIDRRTNPVIDTAPLEQVLRTLGERPVEIDTRPIEAMLSDLGAKLERAPNVAIETRQLENMIRDIGDRIGAGQTGQVDLTPLERMMREFGARLDDAQASAPDARRLENLMQDVSARLDRQTPAAVDPHRLEGLLENIAARLDRPAAPAFDPQALESMLRDIGARIDQRSNPVIDTQPLEQTLRALHDKLDLAASPKLTAKLIEKAVETLSERLQTQRAVAGGETQELASQIAEINNHLGALQMPASSSAALERMVGELLGELDRTRKTLQAASAAEASMDPHLVSDLADLRTEQNNADRRVQATLTGVQDVLEKLVDRIGQIEDDVASVGHSAPYSPATIPSQLPSRTTPPPLARPTATAALNSVDSEYREGPTFAPARKAIAPAEEPGKSNRPPPVAASLRSLDGSDFLIEPGAVILPRGSEKSLAGDVASKTPINAHIAAARRAAQAALAESAAKEAESGSEAEDDSPTVRTLEQAKAFFAGRRRPILLGAALVAIVVTLAALGVGALRQPNIHKAELDPPASINGAADSNPQTKAVTRAVDVTPVGSIDAKSSPEAETGKTAALAPRELVASIPPATPSGLRDAAASGDPAAQYELAVRLAEGRSLPRDLHAASQWFERAALQGLAPAQYRLGSMYEKGSGVARDTSVAKSWYLKAADAGNARAMHNIAVLSAESVGIKPDYSEAAGWFRKAAALGVKDSQYNLAILYARGMGVPQDLNQSWMWFSLAAQQGDVDAGKKRDDIASKMDAKTLEAASATLAAFHTATPIAIANEVPIPSGGWDATKSSGQLTPAIALPQATSAAPPGKNASAL